jgi:hypothetical protein
MKKYTVVLTFLLFTFFCLKAKAQDFTVGDIEYKITSATAPFTVQVKDYVVVTNKTPVIPASVSNASITYSVTSIGAFAFQGNQLTTVTIPNSVTTIEQDAFRNNQLTTVIIPNSVTTIEQYAFRNNQLTTVTIPNSITTIEQGTFQENQLTTVTIPLSVSSIGASAFANNILTSVTIPYNGFAGVSIGDFAFANNILTSITIPNNVYNIGISAFANNNLTSVSIPISVSSIGAYAFANNSLTSVTINTLVTNIGEGAFYNNSLTSITIPTSVTNIGDYAFANNNLTSVAIPLSVTSTGDYVFFNNSLTSVSIPTSVTSIGEGAFATNSLTSVTIPASVTSIGFFAFNSNSLTSVTSLNTSPATLSSSLFINRNSIDLTIPAGSETAYTTAGWTGFKSISSFIVDDIQYTIIDSNTVQVTDYIGGGFYDSSITIPATVISASGPVYNVTSIGDYAFYNNNLISVTIPVSVTSIGESAFGSNNLTSVTSLSTSPVTLSSSVFSNRNFIDLTIPVGAETAYTTAAWTGFKSIIQDNFMNPTLVAMVPSDDAIAISTTDNIVVTFSEKIAFGTGNIQVIDLTDASNSFIIDVASPGSQATISNAVLTINPSSNLDNSSNYAVQIAATALDDMTGNSFAGITENTTFNFTTKELVTPGGLPGGLKLWLKANDGVTVNGSNEVSSWQDQSTNNKTATAVNTPTKVDNSINFNPTVFLNGTDSGLEIASGVLGTETYTDMWVYSVVNAHVVKPTNLFFESMASSERFSSHLPWSDGKVFFDFAECCISGRIESPVNSVTINKPTLWTLSTSTSTTTPSVFRKAISKDGKTIVTSNNDMSLDTRTGNNSNFSLGFDNSSNSNYFEGDIAEMIIYGSKPSAFQQQKVQSYLAIKYGITLDRTDVSAAIAEGHYLNSEGTIIWDTYSNQDYHNNIAVIAKDAASSLDQPKSKSQVNDAILTLEKVGGITTDKEAIALGSNAGNTTFTDNLAPSNYDVLGKIWKMQVTGSPGNVSLSFTIPNNTGDIADYAVFLNTSSADFSTGSSLFTTGSISGDEITFTNVTATNAAYYTLGRKIPTPGNISENIALWIKPGSETMNTTSGVAAIDGETVDTWNDLSGDDTKSFIKGVLQSPILRNNTTDNINYNSVVDFTGDDKGMYISNSKHIYSDGVTSQDGMTWFTVVKPNDKDASKNQQFVYDFGNNSGGGYGLAYGDENFYMYSPADFGGVASAVTNHTNSTQTALTRHVIDFNDNQTVNLNSNTVASKTDAITLAKLTANEIIEFHTSALQNAAGAFTIGRQSKAGGHIQNGVRSYDGKIAEIIGYRKVLSPTENQKIESYLAIKYAITKDNTAGGDAGDYVNSNGDIIWDASINPESHNKVIAIGRGDNQQLLQKQSHSVNDSIRLYVGNLATTNTLNSGSFTNNNSYVIAGGVGKLCATTSSIQEIPSASSISRMEHELKITKTNFNDTFSIDFTMASCADFDINNVQLMVDTDSNFDNGNTTLFADGDNGLSITYNNPVITVSGISSTHLPNNSIRYITLSGINTTLANINTTDATLIDGSFATLGGEVLDLGGTPVTERGIIYSDTNTTPEIGGGDVTKNDNGTNLGVFSEVISGLNLSTAYHFRSYAINSSGTAYGAVKTFTTLANETNNYTASSGQWSIQGNWSLGRIPILTDNVVVLSGNTGTMDITNLAVNKFTNLGTTTISKTSAITVNGDFTNSGTLNVISDANDSGVLLVKGSSAGNISYSRGGLLANKWSILASPVKGDKVISFVQNAANEIRINTVSDPDRYAMGIYNDGNAAGSKWVYFNANTNSNVEIDVARGYSVSRVTDGNVTFTGTLEISNIDRGVTGSQWNAIGNSFTTYYPINKNGSNSFLNDNNTKLEIPAVYVWNASQEKYTAITNLVSSTEQFLPPAQGFFVRPNANTTLLFDDDKRSVKPSSGTHNFSRTTESTPYLKLFVQKESVKINTDIIYSTTATAGFDPAEDIQNFDSASFDINTHLVENSDGKNYTIQSLPKSELEDLVIPVNVKASANDELTISLESFNFPTGINIYIEDKLTNKLIKLNEQNTEYTVTLEEDISGTGRFYLRTTSETLATNSINLSEVVLYKYNNSTVRFTGLSNQKGTFKLFDMLGKQILKTSFEGKISNDIQLPNLKAAVYIIELHTAKGKINKKIIIE